MRKIVHLLDDIALGGVTRLISSLIPTLADEFDQQQLNLCTRFSLPPRIEADVILVHFTLGWTKLAFLFGLRLRAPRAALVVVEHTYTRGFENLNVPRRWRFRKLLRISYALADRIVCVSAGQRRWMLQAGLAAANKTFMIPCVLDLTPFAAIAEPSRQQGPMKLGAFGRFSRQKAYDTLIEAMRRVPPATAELALAGYGEDETALRAAAFGLPHVHIHGKRPPLAADQFAFCAVSLDAFQFQGSN
jgi:glycosyltransferase involved in cell wall biosynthesis